MVIPSVTIPAAMPAAMPATDSGQRYLPTPDALDTISPNQSLMPLTSRVSDRGTLTIGGCDVTTLVQRFGSPLYILDEWSLRAACRQYRQAFQQHYPGEALVLYASKAWNCLAVCAIIRQEGLGIDVMSGGELYTALKAGIAPETIYLHGNNKSVDELQMAIAAGCTIIVDNWLELKTLANVTASLPSTSHPLPSTIRIMLRLTPGIECHTHEYIRTGQLDSKFGFDPGQLDEVFQFVSQSPALNCVGLHAHIGSQIFELQPHQDLGAVMVQWLTKAAHYGLAIAEVNVGGGLGIRYTESDDPPSIGEWGRVISEAIATACRTHNLPFPRLLCEPGRSLIGTACVTAYTLGSQKVIPSIRTYWSVDGGMSDNPRPITYQSVYRAVIADRMTDALTETVTIAGKHCESGDILIRDCQLPKADPGDVLVVLGTGAYNYSMASNYNRLSRPAAVLVNNGDANLILRRETYDDLIRQDYLPEHLV